MGQGIGTGAEEAPRARSSAGVRAGVHALLRQAADLVLPPQCLSCAAPLAAHGALCPGCWARLRLIERPYCARLGTPFPHDFGAGALSPEAIADPPPFDRCRAVAVFGEVARDLVHALKYRDQLELAAWMGGWMARAGRELLAEADVVVAVPLHARRLWWRRYNQSMLLARAVAAAGGRPLAPLALKRVRSTAQQVGLSSGERERNVRGAFRVSEAGRAVIAGRRVLLVDDVFTTGATVKAAARVLLRSGAGAVDVLVFARVVRGEI